MPTAPRTIRDLSLPAGFDLLALHRLAPDRYPYLLESVAHGTGQGTAQGRYDILFAFPGEERVAFPGERAGPSPFLADLDRQWGSGDAASGLPAFAGGWFLYLGYELAAQLEPRLKLPSEAHLPIACAVRVPVALVRDRAENRAWAVAEPGHEAGLRDLERDLGKVPGNITTRSGALARLAEPEPGRFLSAVESAKAAIAAGDIYQANLSRQWQGTLEPDVAAWEIYARLRDSNPAPFAALARLPGFDVASSSPERLVKVTGGTVETRPIAGTRPRSIAAAENDLRAELLAHPKERAEHIMLIDLERNDLGRICTAGSVHVSELMVVESYRHVHHIVSNVQGRLKPGTTPGQVIRAVFPGGTITGCPKVRCMELIAELEGVPRGPYTGSLGYLNRDGSLDLNILIRTIVSRGAAVSLAAGSGIVADSDPAKELEETRAKAKGMVLALAARGATG